ncbi:MAG: Ca-activated chloride channel family protein [Verrucomicrobiales bacterium]|jgi:Ca-activated chloride channel family protein
MNFIWPVALAALGVLPVVAVLYVFAHRRSSDRRSAATLGMGYTAAKPLGKRKHLGPVLSFLALASLLVGFARPEATIDVPTLRRTVMLAFDTSQSMVADDLGPTRLEAAKEAARTFVDEQDESVEVGVVSFGSAGAITLRPTNDRTAIVSSIDRLQAAGGTSLSEGLFSALSAIAKEPIIYSPDVEGTADIGPVDFGGFGSAIIIVFSDGEDTTERDPAPLAELASTAGIRIYPVGMGSVDGAVIETDGFSISTALDEASLQDLAERSNGTYFHADSLEALALVTNAIEQDLEFDEEELEITSFFAIGALSLLAMAGFTSLRQRGRLP